MGGEHAMPILVALLDRGSRLAARAHAPNAGVVNQDINRAEGGDEFREDPLDRRAVRDVRYERSRAASCTFNLGSDVLRRLGPYIVHTDARPLAREHQGHLSPQSRAPTGYQHRFIPELHRRYPTLTLLFAWPAFLELALPIQPSRLSARLLCLLNHPL